MISSELYNIEKKISIGSMAKFIGYSPSHSSRLFPQADRTRLDIWEKFSGPICKNMRQ